MGVNWIVTKQHGIPNYSKIADGKDEYDIINKIGNAICAIEDTINIAPNKLYTMSTQSTESGNKYW